MGTYDQWKRTDSAGDDSDRRISSESPEEDFEDFIKDEIEEEDDDSIFDEDEDDEYETDLDDDLDE